MLPSKLRERLFSHALLLGSLILPWQQLLGEDAKAPVPAEAVQKEIEKGIKDLYKEQYAKKSADDMKALARKFLRQRAEPGSDLATRYVVLREARDLAAQGGDAVTAMAAVMEMANLFEVDTALLKTSVIEAVKKSARTASR